MYTITNLKQFEGHPSATTLLYTTYDCFLTVSKLHLNIWWFLCQCPWLLNNVFLFGLDMFVSDDSLMRKKPQPQNHWKAIVSCILQDVFKFKVWVIFFSNQSKYFSNVKVVFSYDMYHDAFSGISDDIE